MNQLADMSPTATNSAPPMAYNGCLIHRYGPVVTSTWSAFVSTVSGSFAR